VSLFFLVIFVAALFFQALVGHADFNEDQDRHGDPRISLGRYVVSSQFGVVVMENWQSEYLQFTLFVLMTVWQLQRALPSPRSSIGPDASRTRTKRSASTPGAIRRAGPKSVAFGGLCNR
jgi:hypothetical protein